MQQLRTGEEAYRLSLDPEADPENGPQMPLVGSSSFVCAYCHAFCQHSWGTVKELGIQHSPSSVGYRYASMEPLIVLALCESCQEETIFLDGRIIFPEASAAPMPTADMPEAIYDDFMEARVILGKSPRGAAALLRLAIQKLCPILGATKPDINQAIGELVASGSISPALQTALDTVRVIGNEAVHPGSLDLRDDPMIATQLFRIVNFIVEKAITEPKQLAEIYGSLPPNKLAGIAQRDSKSV